MSNAGPGSRFNAPAIDRYATVVNQYSCSSPGPQLWLGFKLWQKKLHKVLHEQQVLAYALE